MKDDFVNKQNLSQKPVNDYISKHQQREYSLQE